ncbi:hypothetical protein ACHAQA_009546 [Verticillium albo-atrum]
MSKYQALKHPRQIRVIRLQPGRREDPLAGTIQPVDLGQVPYEALSYVWGPPNRTAQFHIKNSSIGITPSLHNALRDLRGRWTARTVWADGLSINQDDLDERSQQVALMGEIYRNATRVVTYVGPEEDDSSLAIKFATDLVRYALKRYNRPDPRIHIAEELPNVGLPARDNPRWEALKKLLMRTWATDPRDKVYSILGLASDRDAMNLTVDYTQSTEDLYIDVASKVLTLYPEIGFLSHNLGKKKLDLPSWVPDWSTWAFGTEYVNRDWSYSAAGSTRPNIKVHGKKIDVSGCLVDQITGLSTPIGPHYFKTGSDRDRNEWLQEQAEFIKHLEPYPGESDLTNMLWRTLIGDLASNERPASDSYRAHYDAHSNCDENAPAEVKDKARQFIDAVRRKSRNRVLATTGKGYLGAVPEASKVGDWICMFHGGRNLFVIRKEEEESFRFIGPTYVHGLMYGEVLEAGWYREQMITIV